MVVKISGNGVLGAEQAIAPATEPNLAQICGRAADHVAHARQALRVESLDPALALKQLDDAISCLKGLSGQREPTSDDREGLVVAFEPASGRRSA